MRFYTACFGFRQPFKVLCDGTFVHHLLSNRIVPADNALAKTIGGPVKLFTTRSVPFIESITACSSYAHLKCNFYLSPGFVDVYSQS